MSGIYLARTNQKLTFARLHIDALKRAHDDTSWNKHSLIESYNESVLFHLASAYDAFLREIAELYRFDTEHLQGYRSLAQQFEQSGMEGPEVAELGGLERDSGSWLSKLLAAYEACWHGTDEAHATNMEPSSVSEIHVIQVNPDHAEDAAVLLEYQNWFESLSSLISRLREAMQEW